MRVHLYNVRSKVECSDSEARELDRLLTVRHPSARFIKVYRPNWDGCVHFFNRWSGSILTGLVDRIRAKHPTLETVDHRSRPGPIAEPSPAMLGGILLREDQLEAIRRAVAAGRGILSLAVGFGKCIMKGMKIFDAKGARVPVETVRPGDHILTLDPSDWKLKSGRVVASAPNGSRPSIEIVTQRGHRLVTSENHPFLTGFRHGSPLWTEASKLEIGQDVGVLNRWPTIPIKTRRERLNLCRLIGFYLGDGNGTNPNFLRFSCADPALLSELNTIIESFGDELVFCGCGRVDYRVRSRNGTKPRCILELQKFGLMGKSSHTKFIPSCIFRWSKTELRELLKFYLACDGCFTKTGTLTFTSVSEELATGIRDSLLRFGIHGRLHERAVRYIYKGITQKRKAFQFETRSRDSIKNLIREKLLFEPEIGLASSLLSSRKDRADNCDRLPISNRDWLSGWRVRPYEGQPKGVNLSDPKQTWKVKKPPRVELRQDRKMSRFLAFKLARHFHDVVLRRIAKSNVGWDRIASIKKIGMRETWDLEIEGTHSFVAEGIVTHNTEVALALWRCLGVPALHIVHRKDLLIQTVDRARVRLPNAPISAIGDGRVDAGAWRREGYVVGTVQTLLRLIEQDPRILQGVGLILLDECHSTGSSNRWSKVANLCPAFYRFGLSGTPYTGDPIRDLTLEGVTGPPLMRVASADLIAQGVSVRPIVEIHYVDGPPFVGGWSEARRTVIEGNLRRNGLIIRIAKQESAKGRRTLILCNTVRHVRIIEQAARSAGLEIAVAIGRHRSAHRSAVLRDLKLGLHTVVLSTLFSEGTDVPELDTLILAGSGKSPIRLLQRIGRALRSSPHKKFARVVDFWDSQSTITERHSKARLALCEREGFEVRVVESS